MTCCESDMTLTRIICVYPEANKLQNKEWVDVTGIIRVRYDETLKRDIPVCRVVELKKSETPGREIITLV